MGFNRLTAAADVAFSFICSQDTAILHDAFDAQAAIAELSEDEAFKRYIEAVCGKDGTAEQVAELKKLIGQDDATREAAINVEKIRLILDRFFNEFSECRVDRSRFESLASVEAVIESCVASARKLRHKQYRETGDETKLGTIGADAIRWRLRMLQPRERAEAKGRLSEQPAGVSQFVHYYSVNRWIVSLVLTGAEGWPAFVADKKTGRATEATIDAIDEDWIIEIGDFILEVPTLRKHEKKA